MRNTMNEYLDSVYNATREEIEKYLCLHCYRMEDVKDLLQNVYMHLIKRVHAHGTNHILSPKHYLKRIAKDELTRYYREKSLCHTHCMSSEEIDSTYSAAEFEEFLLQDNTFDFIIASECVWSEIKKLDVISQRIFVLRFIYDQDLKTIARQTKLPENTVKTKLYRGLSKIKNALKGDGNL